MFADGSADNSAFWVSIISAIGIVLINALNAWLAYKSKQSSDLAQKASAINTGLIIDNTAKTMETQKTVNGRMDEIVKLAAEKAHAEGVLVGRSELNAKG